MPSVELPDTLTLSRDGDVLVVRLTRAAKRNALDLGTVQGLGRLFAELAEGIGAVVIHGDGEHFCAGLDLKEAARHASIHDGIAHSRTWHRAFHEIQFGRVPVVSVLAGAVVGGGLELAAATHIRVAESSAFYALPEAQRGLFLGGGGSVRITRLIGVARVQDLMLTGRVLSAEEGHAAGISQYLVAPGEGLSQALGLAHKIAGNAAITNFAALQALPRIAESDPAAGLFTESLMAAIAGHTPEAQQRLQDFFDKKAFKAKPDP
ncbi:crotonase/enoyl-CoA hydratase family protein [Xanthobacteraceae bacterium Astr-EGSB]|uniref:crotonase/enoyl-CoA hydratase family protein n=1 Tax=Astrobacterium formosum TaxID=3069710 RepID=UPI0027AEA257|nr:crotonase/enoyl-CoA hydratase family protein [Xanthobacteraceae bacterium Astr-EGSB]